MKLLIVEGLDKVGKTSVMKEYNGITNFRDILIDRSLVSYLAYGLRYKRPTDIDSTLYVFGKIKPHVIIVHVTANDEVIKQRLKDSSHEEIDLAKDKECFNKILDVVQKLNYKIVTIDTTTETPLNNAKKLKAEIDLIIAKEKIDTEKAIRGR